MENNIDNIYNKIISLNPRLKNRDESQVKNLIGTILDCGYEWNEKISRFYNKEINISVRTEGLDLFDSERFLKSHKVWSNQNYISASRIVEKYFKKLIYLFLTDILVGWLFIPIKIWIGSLLFLIVVILILRKIAHVKMHKAEKIAK